MVFGYDDHRYVAVEDAVGNGTKKANDPFPLDRDQRDLGTLHQPTKDLPVRDSRPPRIGFEQHPRLFEFLVKDGADLHF